MNQLKNRKKICKQLSLIAKENGITQNELSSATGIKQQNISRIFSGQHSPTLDVLLKVCEALNAVLIIKAKK